MRFDPSFLDEIKDRLPISEVAARRVQLRKAGPEWKGISPFNAERSPSFFVNDRKRFFHCFSSGNSGDIFKFLMLVDGLTFPQAVEQCARDAGLDMPAGHRSGDQSPEALARHQAERAEREAAWRRKRDQQDAAEARRSKSIRELAHGIWQESTPLGGTVADRYLLGRGIPHGSRCRALRSHASLEHRSQDDGLVTRWPALVAAVQSPDATFLAVWRIYLDPLGHKAPIPGSKLGLGSYTEAGGAVRLGPPGPAANVCEGIETGLAVLALQGFAEPVYAALSTSGMVNFVPPAGTERVLIWPDGDTDRIKVDRITGAERHTESPGLRAARALRDRLRSEGWTVSIQPTPKSGRDYLDVYIKAKALLNDVQ